MLYFIFLFVSLTEISNITPSSILLSFTDKCQVVWMCNRNRHSNINYKCTDIRRRFLLVCCELFQPLFSLLLMSDFLFTRPNNLESWQTDFLHAEESTGCQRWKDREGKRSLNEKKKYIWQANIQSTINSFYLNMTLSVLFLLFSCELVDCFNQRESVDVRDSFDLKMCFKLLKGDLLCDFLSFWESLRILQLKHL